jgi:NAD(P)-dependent dehydrogenase (short-subunit alcohol dehydrogenase family)
MTDFKDKIAVVTGGANGIGKCIVEELSRNGAKAVVIDKADSTVECDFFYQGDIAEKSVLEDFSKKVIEKYGNIDCLINNACSMNGGINTCSYEDFLHLQKVGVVAPFMLSKLFLNNFNAGASIVNIASTRVFQSQEDTESYTATKGGIVALTHALAVSLKGKVRVNCISPGWIDTTNSTFSCADNEQHPVERVGKPIDIAKVVVFLCSGDAGFITGENIIIDGGMSKLMVYHNDFGWEYKPNGQL